jgi:hypothetical protein
MIERDFDVPFVADLALREKQIQEATSGRSSVPENPPHQHSNQVN